LLQKSSCF